MFKISIIDTPRTRTLLVEGKLVSPWTTELQKACRNAGQDLEGRTLAIDLKNVTLINQEAEDTLLDLINHGARFSCSGVLNKYVLKQLARKSRHRLRELLCE
jgi:hypothetical protein